MLWLSQMAPSPSTANLTCPARVATATTTSVGLTGRGRSWLTPIDETIRPLLVTSLRTSVRKPLTLRRLWTSGKSMPVTGNAVRPRLIARTRKAIGRGPQTIGLSFPATSTRMRRARPPRNPRRHARHLERDAADPNERAPAELAQPRRSFPCHLTGTIHTSDDEASLAISTPDQQGLSVEP